MLCYELSLFVCSLVVTGFKLNLVTQLSVIIRIMLYKRETTLHDSLIFVCLFRVYCQTLFLHLY